MSTNEVFHVTMERLLAEHTEYGMTLTQINEHRAAFRIGPVVGDFLVFPSTIVVRADHPTTRSPELPFPEAMVVANELNLEAPLTRASVVYSGPTVVLRVESEFMVAAGMTKEQLSNHVKRSVEALLHTLNQFARRTQPPTTLPR